MSGAEERSTADEQERAAILAAMTRVLSGETSRKLTIKDLAAEAGLDRYFLTQKHADLKDLFYERVQESGSTTEPAYVTSLREEKQRLDDRCKERAKKIEELTAQNERFVEYLVVATARIRELEEQLARTAEGAQQTLRLLPQEDMPGRLPRG